MFHKQGQNRSIYDCSVFVASWSFSFWILPPLSTTINDIKRSHLSFFETCNCRAPGDKTVDTLQVVLKPLLKFSIGTMQINWHPLPNGIYQRQIYFSCDNTWRFRGLSIVLIGFFFCCWVSTSICKNLAPRIYGQRVTKTFPLLIMLSVLSCCENIALIFYGTCSQQYMPVCSPRGDGECRRHQKNLGPHASNEFCIHFWKSQVVTGRHAQLSQGRITNHEIFPRRGRLAFSQLDLSRYRYVKEMDLLVGSFQLSIRV